MHFAFTEDQELLRDAVRDMLAGECPPAAVRAAFEAGAGGGDAPSPVWAQLAGLGVAGLRAPESVGGLGMDEVDLALLLEQTGYAGVPDPVVEHVAVAVPLLAELAPRSPWLPQLVSGEALASVGLPGQLVARAASADVLLLNQDGAWHAVPRGRLELDRYPSVDATRGVAVPSWEPSADTIVVADGAASYEAAELAADRGAWGAACQLLGVAQRLLDMAVEYASVRTQFGRSIGSFQAVQHQLVEVAGALVFARPVVYRAAWSIANRRDDRAVNVSMAKAYASDAATLAAKRSLQVHGAIGYTVECDLHLWMKRAWALAAAWGDARWHRARVAGTILPLSEHDLHGA